MKNLIYLDYFDYSREDKLRIITICRDVGTFRILIKEIKRILVEEFNRFAFLSEDYRLKATGAIVTRAVKEIPIEYDHGLQLRLENSDLEFFSHCIAYIKLAVQYG